jgi:hypothetical protein
MPETLNKMIFRAWEVFVYLSLVAVVVLGAGVTYCIWRTL